jgi:hypothetical protein
MELQGGQVWGSRDLQGDSVEDRVSDLLTDLLAPLDVPPSRHRSAEVACAPVPGIAATFIRFAADALGSGRTRTGEIPTCRCDLLARSPPFYALCGGTALAASTRTFKDRQAGPIGTLSNTNRSTLLIVARRLS